MNMPLDRAADDHHRSRINRDPSYPPVGSPDEEYEFRLFDATFRAFPPATPPQRIDCWSCAAVIRAGVEPAASGLCLMCASDALDEESGVATTPDYLS